MCVRERAKALSYFSITKTIYFLASFFLLSWSPWSLLQIFTFSCFSSGGFNMLSNADDMCSCLFKPSYTPSWAEKGNCNHGTCRYWKMASLENWNWPIRGFSYFQRMSHGASWTNGIYSSLLLTKEGVERNWEVEKNKMLILLDIWPETDIGSKKWAWEGKEEHESELEGGVDSGKTKLEKWKKQ